MLSIKKKKKKKKLKQGELVVFWVSMLPIKRIWNKDR